MLPGIIFIIACLLFLLFRRKKQNVTSFTSLEEFAYDDHTTREQISDILTQLTDKEQLHIGMPYDNEAENDYQTMLVQCRHESADFLVCYMHGYGSTAWEAISRKPG